MKRLRALLESPLAAAAACTLGALLALLDGNVTAALWAVLTGVCLVGWIFANRTARELLGHCRCLMASTLELQDAADTLLRKLGRLPAQRHATRSDR